jgi:hypothetical protein
METETETEQTTLGEMKVFEVDHPFTFRGESFKAGERLEVTAEDAKALMSVRTHVTIDGSKLHVLAGRVVGGLYTLERCPDGAHKISFWHRSYSDTDDPWVTVEFLEDVHLLAIAGDRRRLRRSDALQFQHRYQDTSPNASTYHAARIVIHEPRPRPAMSAEESAARSAAVMAGRAKDRSDGWTLGNFKRL